jgi:hypothetical protein
VADLSGIMRHFHKRECFQQYPALAFNIIDLPYRSPIGVFRGCQRYTVVWEYLWRTTPPAREAGIESR